MRERERLRERGREREREREKRERRGEERYKGEKRWNFKFSKEYQTLRFLTIIIFTKSKKYLINISTGCTPNLLPFMIIPISGVVIILIVVIATSWKEMKK